jgi:tetratricopeptide (TPR) repeat protein
MHHQVADVIEELRPDDYESLANHYYESGDVDKALEYLIKAGERALSQSAYNEARRHFGRALEIAEIDGRSEELKVIYLALGDVEGQADFNLSIEMYERALRLAQDPVEQAIIKGKIGRLKTFTGYDEGLTLLEEVVESLDPDTYGNEVALAIASIGRFHHNHGQHGMAIEQLERAREIAEPLKDVETVSFVYVFLAGAYQHLAEVERSNEWAQREIEMGSNAKYALAEAVGNEYLGENHAFMGRWEEALKYADRDEAIGRKNGMPDRVRWAKLVKLWAWRGLGQLERAIEEGMLSLEQAESSGERRLAVLAGAELANTYADKGDFDVAEQLAEVAAERALELEQAYMIATAQDALAYLPELRGDWQEAQAVREVAVKAALGTDNRLIPMVNDPGLAEALLEAGDAVKSEELIEAVLQISGRDRYPVVAARALRVFGRIQAHREEFEPAAETFAEALRIWEEWKSRLLEGRVLLDWAALEAAHGQGDAASDKLERALEIFESSDANFWVDRTRAALDELASEGVSQDG